MYLDRAEDKQEHPWQWITAFSQPPRACSAHDRPCFMNGVDALHSLLEKHGESYGAGSSPNSLLPSGVSYSLGRGFLFLKMGILIPP